MTWKVVWSAAALKEMRRIGRQAAALVGRGVQRYEDDDIGDVKRRRDIDPPAWRLCIGDYRVIFDYDYPAKEVRIQRVYPRGRAYRD